MLWNGWHLMMSIGANFQHLFARGIFCLLLLLFSSDFLFVLILIYIAVLQISRFNLHYSTFIVPSRLHSFLHLFIACLQCVGIAKDATVTVTFFSTCKFKNMGSWKCETTVSEEDHK